MQKVYYLHEKYVNLYIIFGYTVWVNAMTTIKIVTKYLTIECDMGNYSTRPMKKVRAFRQTPYTLDMFPYYTKNEQRLSFSRDKSYMT